jgi:hypothetical protein
MKLRDGGEHELRGPAGAPFDLVKIYLARGTFLHRDSQYELCEFASVDAAEFT